MNNPGSNNRPRRNFKKPGGRSNNYRQNSNSGGFNNSSNSKQARHPELDIVIDSRAAKRASSMQEKYQNQARDARSSGDRVYAEYCLQHAEHYTRILNAYNESRPQPQQRDDSTSDETTTADVVADAPADKVIVPKPRPKAKKETAEIVKIETKVAPAPAADTDDMEAQKEELVPATAQ